MLLLSYEIWPSVPPRIIIVIIALRILLLRWMAWCCVIKCVTLKGSQSRVIHKWFDSEEEEEDWSWNCRCHSLEIIAPFESSAKLPTTTSTDRVYYVNQKANATVARNNQSLIVIDKHRDNGLEWRMTINSSIVKLLPARFYFICLRSKFLSPSLSL